MSSNFKFNNGIKRINTILCTASAIDIDWVRLAGSTKEVGIWMKMLLTVKYA